MSNSENIWSNPFFMETQYFILESSSNQVYVAKYESFTALNFNIVYLKSLPLEQLKEN